MPPGPVCPERLEGVGAGRGGSTWCPPTPGYPWPRAKSSLGRRYPIRETGCYCLFRVMERTKCELGARHSHHGCRSGSVLQRGAGCTLSADPLLFRGAVRL